MSLKSKAKAAKQRENAKKLKLQEQQQMEARVQALKNLSSGFARTQRSAGIEHKFQQSKFPVYERRSSVIQVRSLDQRFPISVTKPAQQLSEEMQQREIAAKERYEEMKKMVQPLFNKGGLQYPDAGAIEAAKKGELRRRS